MLGRYIKTDIVVDVEPYYLYGRLVAYVGKLYDAQPINGVAVHYIGTGGVVCEKYAYRPDEIAFDVKQG